MQLHSSPIRIGRFGARRAATDRLNVALATGIIYIALAQAAPAQAQERKDGDPRAEDRGAVITREQSPGDDREGDKDSERVDESYQPKGVGLGSFLLLPQVEMTEAYNTNIFATETDAKSDFVTSVAPEFRLRSRFSRHSLNVLGRAEKVLYRTYKADNHLDTRLVVDGRYDISRTTELNGFVEAFSRHEERGSPDEAGGVKPTPTQGGTVRVNGKTQEGRYTFSTEGSVDRRLYDDVDAAGGVTINNTDRNRWEYRLSARAGYELFPGYSAITEVEGNRRSYDTIDDSGYDRSSQGYRANVGVGLDISQLVRGDFLVGYLQQFYDSDALPDAQGLSLQASLNWTPSRLTVVVPALERSVAESTTRNASGIVRTTASVLVRHEYARNIVLTGYVSAMHDELEGIDQSNWTYEGRMRAIYAFNPETYVGGEIVHKVRNSNAAGLDYQQSIFSLRFGLRL